MTDFANAAAAERRLSHARSLVEKARCAGIFGTTHVATIDAALSPPPEEDSPGGSAGIAKGNPASTAIRVAVPYSPAQPPGDSTAAAAYVDALTAERDQLREILRELRSKMPKCEADGCQEPATHGDVRGGAYSCADHNGDPHGAAALDELPWAAAQGGGGGEVKFVFTNHGGGGARVVAR